VPIGIPSTHPNDWNTTVREPLQEFGATMLEDHDFGDRGRELRHPIEKPARCLPL